MLNLLLFLLAPFLVLAGAGNVISTPVAQQGGGSVSYLTSSACWAPDPSDTLTITREMLDPVYAQFPNTDNKLPCYGTGEFNGLSGVLGNYTLVRRNTTLIKFKTDTEGGPYYGGCKITGSAIRYIGNHSDGRKIWWADSSYKNGQLDGLVYIEIGSDEKTRTFDIYTHDRWLDNPPGHIKACFIKGGIVPVVEENADLLPPQVVSFTNDAQYTNSGKRPYLDIAGYEENYEQFAPLPGKTYVSATIPPTALLFPQTMHYLIKIEAADEALPKKAANKGRIGTVRGTSGGKGYEYEVYFHAGEFYFRNAKDNSLFIYESSRDVPPSSVERNASLQLGVLNFRVSNEWSPFTPACKPAIYLYPERPMELSVQIIPDGYLTQSNPVYNDGWNVKAEPDGSIYEIKDQKSKIKKNELKAVVTGKSVKNGGSKGREEATGLGGFFVLEELIKKLKFKKPLTVAIQGFGNVGSNIASILYKNGFKVVAVSDVHGAIYDKSDKGFNIDLVRKCKEEKGFLSGCYCIGSVCDLAKKYNDGLISNEELLELPVDILIPAALENVVTDKNAKKIRAKIVFEMANGPTTAEADEILNKKGIMVLPDVLCNSGGVIVSYFEWLQNIKGQKWSLAKVNKSLQKKMKESFEEIWKIHKEKKVNFRTAAYILALQRLAHKAGL